MSGGGKKGGSGYPSEATSLANPITYWRARTGRYPSNAHVWWAFKRPPEPGSDRPPKLYLEVFDPSLRFQNHTGNAEASKGFYIFDAFRMDRSAVSGVGGIPVETTSARPQAVCFHAGRVFYSGVYSRDYNTKVYYSQILERPDQAAQCYQQEDPTSEDIRDLLPSDGGVLEIPEVAQIIHMHSIGSALIVFADNGVWAITGSDGIGFTASDYAVNKLSGTPALSNLSFVDVEGVPMWWNRAGIYTIDMSEGAPRVVSITDQTIKSFYQSIPDQSKIYAKGTYDPLKGQVQYLYRSTPAETETEKFSYDRVLVFDTVSGAWMPWSLGAERVHVKGLFTIGGETIQQSIVPVVVGTDFVVAGTDSVYGVLEDTVTLESKVKYIVNVLPEQINPPPNPIPIPNDIVYVLDDNVLVNTNQVIVSN